MNAIFLTFYTNEYENDAMRLVNSLRPYGLTAMAVKKEDQGSWQKNTHLKPVFIKEQMLAHPGSPVVWVDADALIRKRPKLLDKFWERCDIAAVRWSHPGKHTPEVLSGTIGFASSEPSFSVVDRWIELCQEQPNKWDQRLLWQAIQDVGGSVMVEWLPPEYCFIYDTFRKTFPGLEPVIEHFQKSRKTRK